MPDLSGKSALVTGVTGGIGRAIAKALHDGGATVKISGRRTEVLDGVAAELGDRVEVMPADLSKPGGPRALAERAGAVDVFVANAGIPGTGDLTDYSEEQIDRVVDVNLRAPIQMTHVLLPGMLERGSGSLVYMSSVSGKVASANASLYNATKFGLRGFSLALHEDLLDKGVGVTCIFPGFISDAGMWADGGLKEPPGTGTRTPEQVADAVLRAIERNPREIGVAGLMLRVGGLIGGAAPSLAARIQRMSGGDKVSADLAEAQRAKR